MERKTEAVESQLSSLDACESRELTSDGFVLADGTDAPFAVDPNNTLHEASEDTPSPQNENKPLTTDCADLPTSIKPIDSQVKHHESMEASRDVSNDWISPNENADLPLETELHGADIPKSSPEKYFTREDDSFCPQENQVTSSESLVAEPTTEAHVEPYNEYSGDASRDDDCNVGKVQPEGVANTSQLSGDLDGTAMEEDAGDLEGEKLLKNDEIETSTDEVVNPFAKSSTVMDLHGDGDLSQSYGCLDLADHESTAAADLNEAARKFLEDLDSRCVSGSGNETSHVVGHIKEEPPFEETQPTKFEYTTRRIKSEPEDASSAHSVNTDNAYSQDDTEKECAEAIKCSCKEGATVHFHCHLCDFVAFSLSRLCSHEMLQHKYVREEFASKAIHCPHSGCDTVAPSLNFFQRHLQAKHQAKSCTPSSSQSDRASASSEDKSTSSEARGSQRRAIRTLPKINLLDKKKSPSIKPNRLKKQVFAYSSVRVTENLRELYEPIHNEDSIDTISQEGQLFWGCNACDFVCQARCKMLRHCSRVIHRSHLRKWRLHPHSHCGSAPTVIRRMGPTRWKCEACNVACNSREVMVYHFKAKKHVKAVMSMSCERVENKVMRTCAVKLKRLPANFKPSASDGLKEYFRQAMSTGTKHYCKPCRLNLVYLEPKDLVLHRQSEPHKRWLRKKCTKVSSKRLNTPALLYYCKTCKVQILVRWVLELRAHNNTERHKSRLGPDQSEEMSEETSVAATPPAVNEEPAEDSKNEIFPGIGVYYAPPVLKSYCSPCGLTLVYKEEADFLMHLKTPHHTRNEAKSCTDAMPPANEDVVYLYSCKVCNKQLIARRTAAILHHLGTTEHIQKKALGSHVSGKEPSKVEIRSSGYKRENDQCYYYCSVCDLSLKMSRIPSNSELRKHIRSHRHQSNAIEEIESAGTRNAKGGKVLSWRCKVCDVTIAQRSGKTNHVNSLAHKENLLKQETDAAEFTLVSAEETPAPENMHCDVCNITLTASRNMASHMKSHMHQSNLKKQQAETLEVVSISDDASEKSHGDSAEHEDGWHCDVCQVRVSNHREHCKTIEHIQKESLLTTSFFENSPLGRRWHCSICRVTICAKQRNNHIVGYQHKIRLKQRIASIRGSSKGEKMSKELKQLNICQECNFVTGSLSCWARHIRSSVHLDKVKTKESDDVFKLEGRGWRCIVCNKFLVSRSSFEREKHLKSSTHLCRILERKTRDTEGVKPVKMDYQSIYQKVGSTRLCKLCNMTFESDRAWKNHKQTLSHRKVLCKWKTSIKRKRAHLLPKSEAVVKIENSGNPMVTDQKSSCSKMSKQGNKTLWHCSACNLTGHLARKQIHLRSTKHRLNQMRKSARSAMPNLNSRQSILSNYDHFGQRHRCKACSFSTALMANWKQHLRSQGHRERLISWQISSNKHQEVKNKHDAPQSTLPQPSYVVEGSNGEMECLVCGITAKNIISWNNHISADWHHENVRKHLSQLQDKKPCVSLHTEDPSGHKYACETCGVSYRFKNKLSLHYRSMEHRRKIQKLKSATSTSTAKGNSGSSSSPGTASSQYIVVGKDFYNCQLCDVTTRNQITWKYHLQTRRHLQKVSEFQGGAHPSKTSGNSVASHKKKSSHSSESNYLVIPQTRDECYQCKLCNVTTRNELSWNFHLKTHRHQENLEKHHNSASSESPGIALRRASDTSQGSNSTDDSALNLRMRTAARHASNKIKDVSFLEKLNPVSVNRLFRAEDRKRQSASPTAQSTADGRSPQLPESSYKCKVNEHGSSSSTSNTINININLSQSCRDSHMQRPPKSKSTKSKKRPAGDHPISPSLARPKRKSAEDAENRIKDLSFLDTMSMKNIMRMVETKQHLEQADIDFHSEIPASRQIPSRTAPGPSSKLIVLDEDEAVGESSEFRPMILDAGSISSEDWHEGPAAVSSADVHDVMDPDLMSINSSDDLSDPPVVESASWSDPPNNFEANAESKEPDDLTALMGDYKATAMEGQLCRSSSSKEPEYIVLDEEDPHL